MKLIEGKYKLNSTLEVNYLGYIFDSNLSGRGMVIKVLYKISSRFEVFIQETKRFE